MFASSIVFRVWEHMPSSILRFMCLWYVLLVWLLGINLSVLTKWFFGSLQEKEAGAKLSKYTIVYSCFCDKYQTTVNRRCLSIVCYLFLFPLLVLLFLFLSVVSFTPDMGCIAVSCQAVPRGIARWCIHIGCIAVCFALHCGLCGACGHLWCCMMR